ncbi:uncharacterized protein Dvar_25820 [Desulfosarcina variabilis str. Montpellier]|uniref:hypothetical protein n=1 Tax=Desulfosarcina variabilis TaxID=2300 RepID=UPI003AFAFB22
MKNRENNKFDIRKKPVAVSVASVPRQQTVMQPGGFCLNAVAVCGTPVALMPTHISLIARKMRHLNE